MNWKEHAERKLQAQTLIRPHECSSWEYFPGFVVQ